MGVRYGTLLVGLVLAGCTAPSRSELIAGKECTPEGRCAEGYTCDDRGICVRLSGGGGSAGAAGACTSPECRLTAALRHRYRFGGTGTVVLDSVGDANGSVVGGATLAGDGELELLGFGSYVDLPNGIVSRLTDATFELWVEWGGGASWQRLFDFGDALTGTNCGPGSPPAPEGTPGDCSSTTLCVTPQAAPAVGYPTARAYMKNAQSDEAIAVAPAALPVDVEAHVAVVVSGTDDALSLYVDGELASSTPLETELAELNDINNWLGRSQHAIDATFTGHFREFRIYDEALDADTVQASFEAGPNPAFLE